jgi:hypothetical protein
MTTGERFRVLPLKRPRRARSFRCAGLALLMATPLAMPGALAAVDPAAGLRARADSDAAVAASRGKSVVTVALEQGLCLSLAMPAEWQVTAREGPITRLKDWASGIELDVTARSAAELRGGSHPDLARRDAAVLQAGYEALIGKPAQAVSLEPLPLAGALVWRATWLDTFMPGGGGSFTAETLIVPLAPEWLVEVTIGNVDAHLVHDALVAQVLSNLDIRRGADCGRQAAPASR